MEGKRIPKKILHMNLKTMRLRGRPRNRWQDEVREDGRLVGGKGWKERVYKKEESKKPWRMARNYCILHIPMELMNECMSVKLSTGSVSQSSPSSSLPLFPHPHDHHTFGGAGEVRHLRTLYI